jgi:CheY-like chemotaxis protein
MPKVLLVEDDVQLRQVMRGTLRNEGFTCDEAENGRVGLEKMCEATFRREPFDLVLLDIIMPEVDGWQFLQALKANPLWSRTKVVIMSGRAISARDVARATAMDCVHVEKRVGFIDTLVQMLSRMMAPAQ